MIGALGAAGAIAAAGRLARVAAARRARLRQDAQRRRMGARAGREGLARRVALVAPTAADARDVMVEGESGLLAVARPTFRPLYEPSKRRLTWPNGAVATCYLGRGAGAAARAAARRRLVRRARRVALRGGVGHADAGLAARRRSALRRHHHAEAGARWCARCSPTATRRGDARRDAARTRANLAPAFLDAIVRRYDGTRLGRQELEAELLEDVPGALWRARRARARGARVAAAPALRAHRRRDRSRRRAPARTPTRPASSSPASRADGPAMCSTISRAAMRRTNGRRARSTPIARFSADRIVAEVE